MQFFKILVCSGQERIMKRPPGLALPFNKDTPPGELSETWFYTTKEFAIHGHRVHYGIDFASNDPIPICASAPGFVAVSYQSYVLKTPYQGRSVGFGYGTFALMWHPHLEYWTLYGHMERLPKGFLPFKNPTQYEDGNWYPDEMFTSVDKFMEFAKEVKKGEILGYMGTSGCTWGYEEAPTNDPKIPKGHVSWDERHLHFEVFTRTPDGTSKSERIDPFGIKGSAHRYPNIHTGKACGLWLPDENGCFAFARV